MPRPPKPEGTRNQRLSITLPPELDRRLRDYCKQNERQLAWVIQKALDEWLTANS